MTRRCLDLFSGAASGWTLGVHRAGWRTVAACEFDPWRRAVFAARWPGVQMYDDVRTLTADQLRADGVGPIDCIIGSPPCPDFSTANAGGRGVDGERGALFFEYVRLVREVRPFYALAENVPGIRTRGIDRILVAMEAMGYAGGPIRMGAWHAGAPHRRERFWFVWRRRDDADAHGQGQHGEPQHGEVGGPLGRAFADADQAARADVASGLCPDRAERPAGPRPGRDGALAHPGGDGVRQQQGRRGGPDGPGAAELADDDGDTDHPRLAQREGERGDARAEQQTAIGASLRTWDHWNGGAPNLGRVDDGLSAALAARRGLGRACLAAYGDSVVPALTEQIARAIDAVDLADMLA